MSTTTLRVSSCATRHRGRPCTCPPTLRPILVCAGACGCVPTTHERVGERGGMGGYAQIFQCQGCGELRTWGVYSQPASSYRQPASIAARVA